MLFCSLRYVYYWQTSCFVTTFEVQSFPLYQAETALGLRQDLFLLCQHFHNNEYRIFSYTRVLCIYFSTINFNFSHTQRKSIVIAKNNNNKTVEKHYNNFGPFQKRTSFYFVERVLPTQLLIKTCTKYRAQVLASIVT